MSRCLVCHFSLSFTAHYGDMGLASLPPSYLSAQRWRVEVMENSGALLMIDSFHISCPSTWLTSIPHTSAHSSLVLLTSPWNWQTTPPPLPNPHPSFLSFPFFPLSTPSYHIPVWTSFCLPLQTSLKHPFTLSTINVNIRPRAPNPTAECVILTAALQKHTVLKWHLVTYRL